ncbi:hypothetical protein GCM10009080_55380 [Cupriavidus pauculus]
MAKVSVHVNTSNAAATGLAGRIKAGAARRQFGGGAGSAESQLGIGPQRDVAGGGTSCCRLVSVDRTVWGGTAKGGWAY